MNLNMMRGLDECESVRLELGVDDRHMQINFLKY